ncbi:PfkB family carbohydrate kinase [Desulfofundulus thermocisternus]|uniref:PfkB family carbohydrate kinase n=1 Tax=Desulfofundulus thermocisternus TaxID=42471 RepID=UPI00217CEA8A|nr:PfkB family carbohydrate kinase [Desulfofundulus thermocisternus]MCS5697338.1 PfkB family carbohydrate kinase [Desulfofundulus thermocisternus]
MEAFDLVVVGEVCLDIFEGAPSPRPGGAFYSAYAGSKLGAKTAILGHMGQGNEKEILPILRDLQINYTYLQRVPGPTTHYILRHVDEVLPLTANVKKNLYPVLVPHKYPRSKIVLFYPCPNLDYHLNQWPNAIKGLDVQYELNLIKQLEYLCNLDVVFISSSDVCSKTGKTVSQLVEFFFNKGVGLVVTKFGPGGSSIYQRGKGERIDIPAFKSNYKWTVGAGDIYNAVFLLEYNRTGNLERAGRFASLASANFIEQFELDDLPWSYDELVAKGRIEQFMHPEQAGEVNIYLAGPFFSQGEKTLVSYTYHALKKCGFNVYSPWHEQGVIKGIEQSFKTFKNNVLALESASAVVALLDYEDPGTVWECGYAKAKGIPIYALQTLENKLNLMVEFGVELICPSLRCLIDCLYLEFARVRK